jgi:hypothetical protein
MNALATTHDNALETVNLPVDIAWPDLQAAIAGNLNKLSAEGQVKYYNALCKFTGLNPLGFPFEWITFQGKLKLYPKKECADQLRGIHKITAEIIERVFHEDIYMVRVKSTMPDGRHFESTGAVPYLKGMPALEKCKAIKVAETQAYRRGTFGLVGLGNLPDEDSETPASVTSIVETGAESVSSRAALANAELDASPGAGNVIDLKSEPEAKPISQEPSVSSKAEVQPPVAATATVREPEQPAAAPVATEVINATEPPDDFPDEADNAAGEKLAMELELVFSEYPQPRECVAYVISQKKLVKTSSLASIDPVYAKKILNNPKGFLRAVENWVKGGKK